VSLRSVIGRAGIRLFASGRGQAILDRLVDRLDFWRGYGAGAYLDTSGEHVLFSLINERTIADERKVIIDAGANIGEFTAAALKALGERGVVHAFEPAKAIFEQLRARFAGNQCVVLNNCALGGELEKRDLYGTPEDAGMASLVRRDLKHLGLTTVVQEKVEVKGLANYCAEAAIDKIVLLKIDVEGFELEVLKGAELLFANRQIDLCSFEFGGCNLDSRTFVRDFFDFFQKYDMQLFRITPAATIVELPRYHEQFERFTTTNYVAVRQDMFG
jgi:FkbM family methyltransferase